MTTTGSDVVVLEGDRNVVEVRAARDSVRDSGSGNRVRDAPMGEDPAERGREQAIRPQSAGRCASDRSSPAITGSTSSAATRHTTSGSRSS